MKNIAIAATLLALTGCASTQTDLDREYALQEATESYYANERACKELGGHMEIVLQGSPRNKKLSLAELKTARCVDLGIKQWK